MAAESAIAISRLIPRLGVIRVGLDRFLKIRKRPSVIVTRKLGEAERIKPFGGGTFVLLRDRCQRRDRLRIAYLELRDAFGGYGKIQILPFRSLKCRDADHLSCHIHNGRTARSRADRSCDLNDLAIA